MFASGTSRLLIVLVVTILVGTAWYPVQRLVKLNATLEDAELKFAKWSGDSLLEDRYRPDANPCSEYTFGGGYSGSSLDQEYEQRRCAELTAELDAMMAERETPEYWNRRIQELQTIRQNEVLSWLRLAGILTSMAVAVVLLVRWVAVGFSKNRNVE